MKNLIGAIICFFRGRHKYVVHEEFKRIGTNEHYKIYKCERCGEIHHEIITKINP